MSIDSASIKEIKVEILRQVPAMVRMRRSLHRHPEEGWCEVRTSALIAQQLSDLGYEVLTGRDVCWADARLGLPDPAVLDAAYQRAVSEDAPKAYADAARDGFTGVIGILHCGKGPVLMLRFDIDALPIQESDADSHFPHREGFGSAHPGSMHACGHDGHTAVGLTVARLLLEHRSRLHGTIKLLFQPAEEGVRGAHAVAAAGHLDDVDILIGSHIFSNYGKKDQLGVSAAPTLATTKLDAVFHGLAAHAGEPDRGHNAMLAMASAILNLQAIPRHHAGASRINVGRAEAGSGRNVICDEAKLELEVRGATTEINAYMEHYAREILSSAAAMHGCTCEITTVGSAPSHSNDKELVDLLLDTAKSLSLQMRKPDSSASFSEDFAQLSSAVRAHGGKSLFFYALTDTAAPGHSPEFDFHEEALTNAVLTFCALTWQLLS